jgi:integrase
MLRRRGRIWWYRFKFGGRVFEETTRTRSKRLAERALVKRRSELEEGLLGLKRRITPVLFRVAAKDWLAWKEPSLAPRTVVMHRTNLSHINAVLGGLLITDIGPEDVGNYQKSRLEKKDQRKAASPKTVNLEVATIRGVLRRHKLWAAIGDDVRMLPVRNDQGRALTEAEEGALLEACVKSRSRLLYPFVVVALNTGMRYSEIRLLRWQQIDLVGRVITVGASKTDAGNGRKVPLNEGAFRAMVAWAQVFPDRKPDHYVFPSERYGIATNSRTPCVYSSTPMKPTTSVQEAWQRAKKRCSVRCRLHDLRHTACTRMLEAGVPLTVVGAILGWSGSTMVLMAKRYGHIGPQAKHDAVAVLDRPQAEQPREPAATESPRQRHSIDPTIN